MAVFWRQKHAIKEHACRKKAAFYVRIKQNSNGTIAPCGHNGDSDVVYREGIYVPPMRHAMAASNRQNVGMRDTARQYVHGSTPAVTAFGRQYCGSQMHVHGTETGHISLLL